MTFNRSIAQAMQDRSEGVNMNNLTLTRQYSYMTI